MDKIRIRGGNVLSGKLPISGAKNAALPLLAASLLTDDTLTLSNLPRLADISTMGNLLEQHGVDIKVIKNGSDRSEGRTATLTAREITSTTAPYDLVRKMRASVLVLGPLVARCGEAQVSLPGGCAIGTRPVDLHLHGLEQMGAEIELKEGLSKIREARHFGQDTLVFAVARIRVSPPNVGVGHSHQVQSAWARAITTIARTRINGEGSGILAGQRQPRWHLL